MCGGALLHEEVLSRPGILNCTGCVAVVCLHSKYLYGTFMSTARVPCPQEGAAQTSVSPLGDKVQGLPKASPRPPWDESLGRSGNPGSHRLCCYQDSGAWEGERPESWGPARVRGPLATGTTNTYLQNWPRGLLQGTHRTITRYILSSLKETYESRVY